MTISKLLLEFLPHGGLFKARCEKRRFDAYLPGKRFDLVVALAQPPGGYRPGDLVSDQVLWTCIWGLGGGSRTDMNLLVHRVRKDLDKAGLEGVSIVQRAPGGGATRLAIGEVPCVTVL